MRLAPEMGRIVGVLIEKQLTTPQQYPLTLNALVVACNQSSNREPVVEYEPELVLRMIGGLRQGKMVLELPPGIGRGTGRYRHTVDLLLSLDQAEIALLSVLLLRGAQTVGELRARSERMAAFTGLDAVEAALQRLEAREEPLARPLKRRPGQKEVRWIQLLAGAHETVEQQTPARPPLPPTVTTRAYEVEVRWTGDLGQGTGDYTAYSRDHEVAGGTKPVIAASSDTASRGAADRWNPEDLLVASLAQCHMLWYLHLASDRGVVVTGYIDRPIGTVALAADGTGRFTEVTLRPTVTVADPAFMAQAEVLHDEAGARCLIARSVAFPVHCRPGILASAPAVN